MYDVIIIGGGPAAFSAGIYTARYERTTLIIAKDLGGQALVAGEMENYPGFVKTNGFELMTKMKEHVQSFEKVELKVGEEAKSVTRSNNMFQVTTDKGEYQAKSVIICSGKRSRKLNVKGEPELTGKGVSYCATCDGPFAKGKDAIIIGGGYAAVEAALIIEKVAKSVSIVNINEDLDGESITINKVKSNPKIKIFNLSNTIEIIEKSGVVGGVIVEDKVSKQKTEIAGQIVFVEIGSVPNTEFLGGLVNLNERNEITIDKNQQTSIEGVFAAGDVTDVYFKQVVVAAGDGAKAAISLNHYLEKFH